MDCHRTLLGLRGKEWILAGHQAVSWFVTLHGLYFSGCRCGAGLQKPRQCMGSARRMQVLRDVRHFGVRRNLLTGAFGSLLTATEAAFEGSFWARLVSFLFPVAALTPRPGAAKDY